MPKVSVVVANYNNAKYLGLCLDSLLAQDYSDFEVLVFDDASTDNSKEIINQYSGKDKRIKLIELPENRGVAYLRSICLSHCLGEYVAVLDADDYSLPKRLSYQANYLDQFPDTVIVGGFYTVIDTHGNVKRKKKEIPTSDLELRWCLSIGNVYIHSTVMFRKDAAIKAGGYDPEIDCAEDMDIYCRLMPLGKLGAIPQLMSCWRTHPKSYSKQASERILLGTYKVLVNNAEALLHRTLTIAEAKAIFNHSGTSAPSKSDFLTAIDVLRTYRDHYWKQCATKEDKQTILRCHLLSLLALRKRNVKQAWYSETREILNRSIMNLLFQDHYNWLFDAKLKTATRNRFHLLLYSIGFYK